MIPGGPTFGVTKRLQKWPRYFAHEALQRGAETDASSIEVRDTAYIWCSVAHPPLWMGHGPPPPVVVGLSLVSSASPPHGPPPPCGVGNGGVVVVVVVVVEVVVVVVIW